MKTQNKPLSLLETKAVSGGFRNIHSVSTTQQPLIRTTISEKQPYLPITDSTREHGGNLPII